MIAPSKIRLLHGNLCKHDGRGPELQRIHYDERGVRPIAIDYIDHNSDEVRHLLLRETQVFMSTPEEVDSNMLVCWSETQGAAVVSLGRSLWLASFNPRHLDQCQHFRIMFYDEFLDVICQDIDVQLGPYLGVS